MLISICSMKRFHILHILYCALKDFELPL